MNFYFKTSDSEDPGIMLPAASFEEAVEEANERLDGAKLLEAPDGEGDVTCACLGNSEAGKMPVLGSRSYILVPLSALS